MERDSKDVAGMSAPHERLSAQNGWPARRQRFTHCSRTRKNCSRAVAMVDVTVDSHCGADFAVTLHAANCDRNIVNHAKAFSVIGKRVVKAAADVKCHSVVQRVLGG